MRRIDLRKSNDFFADLKSKIAEAKDLEVLVILFEIGDFTAVDKCFAFAEENGCKVLNSLKFNQMDWMLTIKKELR